MTYNDVDNDDPANKITWAPCGYNIDNPYL